MSDIQKRAQDQGASMDDVRFPLPIAYGDPAFKACLHEAIGTIELVEQFDRLYGATLVTRKDKLSAMIDEATGKREDDMRAFVAFVHDGIYMRLPAEAIHSLRAAAVSRPTPGAR